VVEALLALISQGDLRPTAARVAQRAGVSLRSVFQHFDDMETLLAAAGARQVERIEAFLQPLPSEGPLVLRIRALVDQRARVLEFVTPVRRAAVLLEPFSPALQESRDLMLRRARVELQTVFGPELSARAAADRREVVAALDAATTWAAWDHLRDRQGLNVAAAKRVITRAITSLLS